MMRVVQMVGARVPLHVTAAGKLFLAGDDAAEVKAYAERTRLPARTPASVKTLAELSRELDAVRKQGYALDREEAEAGVRCVAAVVRDDAGALVAALSVSAPAERQKQAQWTPLIQQAAERISRALGFHG
jgi:DNA-binding IclR family transcriptional regulator